MFGMFGKLGFSYTGLIFLSMLFIPNMMWSKRKPRGYTPEGENKILLSLERLGEALVCCCSLIFSDFNIQGWTPWSLWLAAAFALMLMYEAWWVRYFRSERGLSDFYSNFLCIPLAGATLPVIAFFLLGMYGKVGCMLIAAAILGIGHIGIHAQHRKALKLRVEVSG